MERDIKKMRAVGRRHAFFLYYLIFYFNDLFFFINFAFDFITALADEVDRFFLPTTLNTTE